MPGGDRDGPYGVRRYVDGIQAVDQQRLPRAHVVADPQFARGAAHALDDRIDQLTPRLGVVADGLHVGYVALSPSRVGRDAAIWRSILDWL